MVGVNEPRPAEDLIPYWETRLITRGFSEGQINRLRRLAPEPGRFARYAAMAVAGADLEEVIRLALW
jgi:hypothetical protein